MKKVLFVSPTNLKKAGVPVVLLTIAKHLHLDYQFDVVVPTKDKGFFDKEFEEMGGRIIVCEMVDYNRHRILYSHLLRTSYYKRIKQILNEGKYDVIHCNNGCLAGLFLKASFEACIPVRIIHCHGMYQKHSRYNFIKNIFEDQCLKWIDKYANKFVTCSDIAGKTLIRNGNVKCVYNPVNLDYFTKIKREPHEGLNLIQTGYFCANKNQLFSIEVLEKLINKKIHAHLYFIGFPIEDGTYYKKLIQEIDRKGLSSYITFCRYDVEKKSIYGKMDYFLLPSITEGLNISIMEAQASGIKSISSDNLAHEVDIGNCFFCKRDPELWTNIIVDNQDEEFQIDKKKIDMLSEMSFIDRISNLYEEK